MEDFLRAHLICWENTGEIIDEIKKYCVITGKSPTFKEACLWAKESGGAAPDLFVVNGGEYFSSVLGAEDGTRKALLRGLREIKKQRQQSRIILLLPTDKVQDDALIVGLLKTRVYDFWFYDDFDEKDIREFLLTERTLENAEEYLVRRQEQTDPRGQRKRSFFGFHSRFKQTYKPYYVKSNIIAFWSEDDLLLNQGIALMTAIRLAQAGFKVALLEAVTPTPQLASCLSIAHFPRNIRHALALYSQKNNKLLKNYLFNIDDIHEYGLQHGGDYSIADLPANLYLLPDGVREDSLPLKELKRNWKPFIDEIMRATIFEKDYNFIVLICSGNTYFGNVILNEVAYLKFITLNMLPGSVVKALEKRRAASQENVHLIGGQRMKYVAAELRDLGEKPFLYVPASLEEDFLNLVYLQNIRKIGTETREFIEMIVERTGVKLFE